MASGSFSRDKGQRAEREVVKMLQPVVTRVYLDAYREVPSLERNLVQSHKGGHDIVGLDWLALEVKHHENPNMNSFWEQCKEQAGATREPVLLYKSNRVKWRVVMFGYVPAGRKRVRCPVDIGLEAFLVWFETRLREEVKA